ncbi:MAG: hypothetical protein PHW82_15895 [Bacteroidales bacterium]|nr:hypothetical protein [Bacteroidales bacterium]
MAKIYIYILIIAFGLFACSNNKAELKHKNEQEIIKTSIADAQKMIDKIEKYTQVLVEATKDKNLDDNEIQKIKKLGYEFETLEKEMKQKYSNNLEGKEAMEKYMEDNKSNHDKIYEEFFSAMMALYECEGADKLE